MSPTVILRTGKEMLSALVGAVMLSLEELIEKNPIAFYELVQLVRNPNHQLFGNAGDILRKFNFIEIGGQPHDMTRQIILAATEGEGLNLKLVPPICKKQEEKRRASAKIRDLRDAAFYALTRKAADIIFSSGGPPMEDRRKDGANPYYCQTADGLYLELYYGMPASLWTPWGEWRFSGSGCGSWENILPSLLERFGATLHQPLRTSTMGEFGPVYALHKIDDMPLPDPIELNKAAYASYKDSKAAWKELTEQYKSA